MGFLKNITDNGLPDIDLVKQFQSSGDLEVLGMLYQRYMDLTYGVCLKYMPDSESAKDAVMQVFEELVQKLPKHQVENFRSWLYSLAKNYCLQVLRKQKNVKTTEFNPDDMQSGEELHPEGISPKEENLRKMEKCLEALPTEQRDAVKLFYLENKCYKDIAEITGLEWNRVRSYIQNGRRNLRVCMGKEEEAENLINIKS